MDKLVTLWEGSGLYNLELGQAVMIMVGLLLLYLAIYKKFEPLLLVPIGFGGILANIPEAGLAISALDQAIEVAKPAVLQQIAAALGATLDPLANAEAWRESLKVIAHDGVAPDQVRAARDIAVGVGYSDGMLYNFYKVAIGSGIAPLIIFMGVGAMTDFGPLLANPRTLFLGAAAQFGIFATLFGAVALTSMGIMDFSLNQAAAIGIIGGADGPTSIYVSSVLAPELLGAIAVAAYAYMALVPLIQPPIMRLLTTDKERQIKMTQLRPVSKLEKIIFPLMLLILVALFLPDAAPLLGMFCFGNLMRECGVVERLSDTAQNALINIVTIILGLSVGSKLMAESFLAFETLGILGLGIVAFGIGTAAGVLMAKLMNLVSKMPINPLIGAAGVSAVPMAARVANKVGLESNPHNFLLMHAMGPNVAGVIGSAVAAGVMIKYLG
ncbi:MULTISPECIES: sodium ion-translocating decarboxylase subunit beta [Halomonadaceae]|jgi:carboxybiotin decarboxylase|uniref:Oxaloacetate decarboxylase beta chain n=1 Tax=Vreelandella titanicae TaxID=664683 RepID=A0A654ASN2_9GAMM|nr:MULTISPECIES: sodium ion-translocating decarboxylase subunit beta [Halomonas]UEQ04953.1 sodium ion-translocating decarboxylase subunit beta [Halomonas profundus]MCD1587011.1 sodium ion-translocating decarboxylase subunit beta [Halomonas sp. IOP_14]QKS27082.1 Oxaloacetate decarboxylase beta chain [Halomonas titanicae]QNU62853.1 sodium ion-translocating decarboxylase subunit beta [Halomonas titanicae]TMU20264.1 sodium ion-translocating decarboxylase subunit beta [Halomonas sp. ATBC28]|tara:strand:- start:292 stop:1614 length:1323 start_codon:yes stop_codon:yes gene_type:complete